MTARSRTRPIRLRDGSEGVTAPIVALLFGGCIAVAGIVKFAMDGLWPVAVMFFAVLAVYAWLVRRFTTTVGPTRLLVGSDGLWLDRPIRVGRQSRRFLAFRDFDDVDDTRTDVSFFRGDRCVARLSRVDQADQVARLLLLAREKFVRRPRRAVPTSIAEGDPASLLATVTAPGYRNTALSAVELADIACDATVDTRIRAVAGAVAGQAGSEAERRKLRDAARWTASDELAEVLEWAAEGRLHQRHLTAMRRDG